MRLHKKYIVLVSALSCMLLAACDKLQDGYDYNKSF